MGGSVLKAALRLPACHVVWAEHVESGWAPASQHPLPPSAASPSIEEGLEPWAPGPVIDARLHVGWGAAPGLPQGPAGRPSLPGQSSLDHWASQRETKAQRGQATCPQSHSPGWQSRSEFQRTWLPSTPLTPSWAAQGQGRVGWAGPTTRPTCQTHLGRSFSGLRMPVVGSPTLGAWASRQGSICILTWLPASAHPSPPLWPEWGNLRSGRRRDPCEGRELDWMGPLWGKRGEGDPP